MPAVTSYNGTSWINPSALELNVWWELHKMGISTRPA